MNSQKPVPSETAIPRPSKVPRLIAYMTNAVQRLLDSLPTWLSTHAFSLHSGNRTSSKDKLRKNPTNESPSKTFEKLKDLKDKFEGLSDLFNKLNLLQLDGHEKINSLKKSIEDLLPSSVIPELKTQILDVKGYNESIRKLLDNAQCHFESAKLKDTPQFEPMEKVNSKTDISASLKHFVEKSSQTLSASQCFDQSCQTEPIPKTVNLCLEKPEKLKYVSKKEKPISTDVAMQTNLPTYKKNSKDAVVQANHPTYKKNSKDAVVQANHPTYKKNSKDAVVQANLPTYKKNSKDAVVQANLPTYKKNSKDAVVQANLPTYKKNSKDAVVQANLPIHKKPSKDAVIQTNLQTLSINIKLEPQPDSAMRKSRSSLPGNFASTIQPALPQNPESNALVDESFSEVNDIQIGLGLGSPYRFLGHTQPKNRTNQKTIATQTTFAYDQLLSKVRYLARMYLEMTNNFKKFRQFASVYDEYFQQTCQGMEEQTWEAVNNIRKSNKELARRYKQEMALRKKYHNELMQLRGNIRVFCRIRPPTVTDEDPNSCCISVSANDRDIIFVKNKNKMPRFELDRVFPINCSQSEVFDEIRSLVTSCIDGFNVCILAYGQTGSGKTYTMEGTPNNPGMNQRALKDLFKETALKDDWNYSISVSMLEIYNEQIRDLLNEDATNKLEVWNVEEVTVVPAYSAEEVNKVCAAGHKNRIKAATNLNSASSRSHALLCVRIEGCNQTTNTQTKGKLYLIDLAGSENVEKSGVDGQRLKEAGYINKSLSTFSDVINAILLKRTHIPYRNSKLTHLLQDSLGGNSKTLLLTQVAPGDTHVSETLQTLQFAQRIRSIQYLSSNSKSRERLDSDRSDTSGKISDKNENYKNKEKTDDENSPEPMSSIPPRFSSMFLTSPTKNSPKINSTPPNQTKRKKSLTPKFQ